MTTAIIVIATVIVIALLVGKRDTKHTSFYKQRMKDTHFHY
jgi:hypothetical protein